MKPLAVFATAATTLALGGCATLPDAHRLAGSEWQLTAIDTSGSTTTLTPALQQRHRLAFIEGGEVQVQLDCNRGRSTWTADTPMNGAGTITFGAVASTRMACPAPSFGNDLASGLEQAERYTTTLDGRQLVLETAGLRFTFAAVE